MYHITVKRILTYVCLFLKYSKHAYINFSIFLTFVSFLHLILDFIIYFNCCLQYSSFYRNLRRFYAVFYSCLHNTIYHVYVTFIAVIIL